MSEIKRPPVATVRQVLQEVYGASDMVEELSYEIVDHWGGWARREQASDGNGRTVGEELYLMIWNWFPGGDTAGHAADRIIERAEKN